MLYSPIKNLLKYPLLSSLLLWGASGQSCKLRRGAGRRGTIWSSSTLACKRSAKKGLQCNKPLQSQKIRSSSSKRTLSTVISRRKETFKTTFTTEVCKRITQWFKTQSAKRFWMPKVFYSTQRFLKWAKNWFKELDQFRSERPRGSQMRNISRTTLKKMERRLSLKCYFAQATTSQAGRTTKLKTGSMAPSLGVC